MSAADEPEIVVAFWIAKHDLDADECSRVVGLTPTEVWRQTRAHLMDLEDIPNTQWMIGGQRVRSFSVDDEVARLLEGLSPAQERVRSFLKESGARATITCNVTIYSERPDYSLSAPTIQAIAGLGASFGLDIFDYSQTD